MGEQRGIFLRPAGGVIEPERRNRLIENLRLQGLNVVLSNAASAVNMNGELLLREHTESITAFRLVLFFREDIQGLSAELAIAQRLGCRFLEVDDEQFAVVEAQVVAVNVTVRTAV